MTTDEKKQYIVDSFSTLRSQGVVKTQGEFASLLGIAERSLSSAKNGKEGYLTDSLMSRIKAVMEQYQGSEKADIETVIILPTEAMAGTLGDFALAVQDYECERMVSPIKGADFAIKIQGDSMSPEYPSGAVRSEEHTSELQSRI